MVENYRDTVTKKWTGNQSWRWMKNLVDQLHTQFSPEQREALITSDIFYKNNQLVGG